MMAHLESMVLRGRLRSCRRRQLPGGAFPDSFRFRGTPPTSLCTRSLPFLSQRHFLHRFTGPRSVVIIRPRAALCHL